MYIKIFNEILTLEIRNISKIHIITGNLQFKHVSNTKNRLYLVFKISVPTKKSNLTWQSINGRKKVLQIEGVK